jgi:signal transduction histidine kinase
MIGQTIQLTIADDGIGFDLDKFHYLSGDHYGVKNMHLRAEQINAQFTMDSGIGKGLRIVLSFSGDS